MIEYYIMYNVIYIYIYTPTCIYIYIYIHVYVYIYIYIYVRRSAATDRKCFAEPPHCAARQKARGADGQKEGMTMFGGDHLSKATCLTQVFFKRGE